MEWRVPKIWSGTVYILGGGPSAKGFDFSRLRGQRVIAINSAFEDAHFADVCYFMDCKWFQHNKAKLIHFAGLKVTVCNECKGISWVKWLNGHRGPRTGLSIDEPSKIRKGTNSGYGAIDLAAKLGGTRLILLFYDMRVKAKDPKEEEKLVQLMSNAKIMAQLDNNRYDAIDVEIDHNYHSRHFRRVSPDIYRRTYMAPGKGFDTLLTPAKAAGIEIINATPGSALRDFPIVDPEEVLP